jgi:hypothetical protein
MPQVSSLFWQIMLWFPRTIHEDLWPGIAWREPIKIIRTDGIVRYGCRLCIAEKGLKGRDIPSLWETPEEASAHIQTAHREDE